MSAAPHETDPATPSLRVVPDQPATPSLAQLLGHRTPRAQRRVPSAERGTPPVAPVATQYPAVQYPPAPYPPAQYPRVQQQPPVQQPPAQQRPVRAARALREPTFDELITGPGRHRGAEEPVGGGSLLRRIALKARLLPTPARRPPSRATGTR